MENPPRGTSPIARLGVIQVARGRRDTVVALTGGAPLHTPHYSGPPPPPLKAEWQGGSGIRLSIVDHVDLISTVREFPTQFQTPPPSLLKAKQQGGSGMEPQS
jgi:hypothetical protein